MDVTIFKPLDQTKVFIHIIQDNFSRMILNYKFSVSCDSKTAFENLREACKKYDLLQKPVDLIVDDGVENKGHVQQFVNNQPHLNKYIAQKDVPFSNSMVEYMHQRLKYNFLFPEKIQDVNHLKEFLPKAIHQYNHEIYRHDLGYKTPFETFKNINIDLDLPALNQKARKQRLLDNQTCVCLPD